MNSCPNSRSQKKLSLVNANIDHAVYLLGGKIKKLKMRNKSHLLCGFSAKTLDSHLEITFLSSSFLLLPICCSFSFFKTVKYLPIPPPPTVSIKDKQAACSHSSKVSSIEAIWRNFTTALKKWRKVIFL